MLKKTGNRITSIPIDKLFAHPESPNRMSKKNFARLVRNIERTGRYEPLVVRRQGDSFQIINGRNRLQALKELGHENVDAVVWDLNDAEADIMLCSLNRLKGSDVLEKKLRLLNRINSQMQAKEMARLLPFTSSQIDKLRNMKIPSAPTKINTKSFAVPMVFFLNISQQQIVAEALASLSDSSKGKTKAARNAAALTEIARTFASRHGHL